MLDAYMRLRALGLLVYIGQVMGASFVNLSVAE
jgi:hypothetical protein